MTNNFDSRKLDVINNRAYIVTGAAEGIGLEVARQILLKNRSAALQNSSTKFCIVINDIESAKLTAAANALTMDLADSNCCPVTGEVYASSKFIRTVAGDAGCSNIIAKMVSTAVEAFGRLDGVVCNAGVTSWAPFVDMTPEKLDAVLNLNVRGTYLLAQAAARQFLKQNLQQQKTNETQQQNQTPKQTQSKISNKRRDALMMATSSASSSSSSTFSGGGSIVLLSSVAGNQAIPYLSAYAMSKAALQMLARQLTLELAGTHGIRINCVAPGATVTPRNINDDAKYEAKWSWVTPMKRIAQPVDIAAAVLFFLITSDAMDGFMVAAAGGGGGSRHISGQTLIVDGGWTGTSPTPGLEFVQSKL